jgi:glycerol-3-phosphate dehydrogenase
MKTIETKEKMKAQSSREDLLKKALTNQWDVIIIGGGISGAGILIEAARRGLKALVLEQKDFSWGTSSRSSKMVHGGLRYLKEGNLALTRESVHEKENLINELPGLVDQKLFLLPHYKNDFFGGILLHVALSIYDILSGKWRKHLFSAAEMEQRAPSIGKNKLKGGFIINDAVTDDARLVFRVLSEAQKQGAVALNYCKVEKLIKNAGKVTGVTFMDAESGQQHSLNAKLVISATGAWADQLRKQVKKSNNEKIRPLRGSHLVFSAESLPLVDNISFMHPQDGRPVMALAWEGRVLMGTTDKDHKEDLDKEASISAEEVQYLLDAANYQFPDLKLTTKDIISSQAGIRPVLDTGKANPSAESRDHLIWTEEGLLTVTGGKLTTFRIIALDTLKAAQSILGPLPDLKKKQKIFQDPVAPSPTPEGLDDTSMKRLWGRYGKDASELVKNAEKDELEKIEGTSTLWAELRWAAENEMVHHLDDLLLRRTRIGLLLSQGGKDFLPRIRQMCQPLLKWDDQQWETEESRYLDIWKKFYSLPS